MEKPLSRAALSVRVALTGKVSDATTVCSIANMQLLQARTNISDTGAPASAQAMAVLMLARHLVLTEALHLSKYITSIPTPEIHAALWSIVLDPPPNFDTEEVSTS